MSAQTAAIYPTAIDDKHQNDEIEDVEQATKGAEVHENAVVVTDEDVSRRSFHD